MGMEDLSSSFPTTPKYSPKAFSTLPKIHRNQHLMMYNSLHTVTPNVPTQLYY